MKEELIDADLSKHVFMMITIFPQWRAKLKPPYKPQEHLEMALLHFFDTFQKTYVGEHRGMPPIGSSTALISSAAPNEKQQMYLRYFERLKMGQHTEVIEKIIARLGLNLQDWGSNDTIIGKTLESFTSFVCGYSSGRLLLELDTVKFIIEHHTEKNFQFLKSKSPKISEHRAQFFHALARLIWLQDGAAKFEKFMATHVRMLGSCLKADFSNANVQSAMVAVCRDLLGVARASHNGRTYRMVFDALHPILFQAMDKALREAGHVRDICRHGRLTDMLPVVCVSKFLLATPGPGSVRCCSTAHGRARRKQNAANPIQPLQSVGNFALQVYITAMLHVCLKNVVHHSVLRQV